MEAKRQNDGKSKSVKYYITNPCSKKPISSLKNGEIGFLKEVYGEKLCIVADNDWKAFTTVLLQSVKLLTQSSTDFIRILLVEGLRKKWKPYK